MKNVKILLLLVFIGLLLSSCGSAKKTPEGMVLKKVSPKNILKANHKQAPDFKTLSAKLRGSFEDKNIKQSVNLSLRIKKDDTIWISAQKLGFPLAKLMVTPKGVQFYNKLNRQYFTGDFSLLEKFLGVKLDFENFQNLLLGQLLTSTNSRFYALETDAQSYILKSSRENTLLYKILVDKKTLSLQEEYLKQPATEDVVHIRYPSYFSNPDRNFPDKIYITVSKPNSKIDVQLRYRSLELDTPARFPFSIPKGYRKLKIK